MLPKPEHITLVLGLGNPGPRFITTRHNAGFLVIDALADQYHATWQEKDQFMYTRTQTDQGTIILAKPLTFMNLSGTILKNSLFKNIDPKSVLVIHDELDFELGKLGLKFGGSARGHNGLKSIISTIGDQFWRLRIGIGRPTSKDDVPNYVLEPFDRLPYTDPKSLETIIANAAKVVTELLT